MPKNSTQMKANRKSKETLKALAERLGVTEETLLSHCRKAELVDARAMAVVTMMNRLHLRQQDVAPLFDISQAAVSKLLSRHRSMMETDRDYKERFDQLLTPSSCNTHRAEERHCGLDPQSPERNEQTH